MIVPVTEPKQMEAHLTCVQFDELLAGAAAGVSEQTHLQLCEQCAAELATLRDSLSLFRVASSAHADSELRRRPRMVLPARPALGPAYWAAAGAMVIAAFLPLQVLRQRAMQPAASVASSVPDRAAESDEALLDDVNREVTASVPAPMQALSDPVGDAASRVIQTAPQTPDQTPDQGKD